jgi:hypothetical protein
MSDDNKHPDLPSTLPDKGGSYVFAEGEMGEAALKLVVAPDGALEDGVKSKTLRPAKRPQVKATGGGEVVKTTSDDEASDAGDTGSDEVATDTSGVGQNPD